MDISEIFKMCHQSINIEKDLLPIKDKEIITFLENKKLSVNDFFKTINALHRYCYFNENNGVYIEIPEFTDEYFNMFPVIKQIDHVNEHMGKCLSKQDYMSAFTIMDKKVRIHFLNKWHLDIPQKQILGIFKMVYCSSEYNFDLLNKDILRYIKNASKDELDILDDAIVIYRGQTLKSQDYNLAYSWTTDKKVAKMFANRFKSNGKILTAKINKSDIITKIDDRGESEILVFPNTIYDIKEVN